MKKKCALYASKLVKDGMVVGLGGGSTIQYLIDYVKDKDIQVVTPSAKTALKAQKEGLRNMWIMLILPLMVVMKWIRI